MSDLEMVLALGFSLLSIPFFIFTCVAFSLSKYRDNKSETTAKGAK